MPTEKEYDHQSHLCCKDVKMNCYVALSYLQVTIKASKTDPFRQGVDLYLGATGKELCLMASVFSCMAARGDDAKGPLSKWGNGNFLTRDKFVWCLRMALVEAGYPADKFAGHSIQIGMATTAVDAEFRSH